MDNYTKAYTSLLTMLSGALRIEFIGNETIMEDLTLIKLGLDELQDYKKALDKACELNIIQRLDRDCEYVPKEFIEKNAKELKEQLLKESEQENG